MARSSMATGVLVPADISPPASVCTRVRVPGTDLEFSIFAEPPGESQDGISAALTNDAEAFSPVISLLLEFAKPGASFLDLGSHIGTVSLVAAAAGCRVAAVDASPRNIRFLTASKQLNGFEDLKILHAALSDREGILRFVVNGPFGQVVSLSPTARSKWPAACKLMLRAASSLLGRAPAQDAGPAPPPGSIEVRALSLDMVWDRLGWDRVDLIKMDIEGSEINVLEGAKRLLSRPDAPPIVYECNGHTLHGYGKTTEELRGAVEKYGYRNYLLEDGKLIPVTSREIQALCCVDYLAVKGELPPLRKWQVLPALDCEGLATRVVRASAEPNIYCRRYTARALQTAPQELLDLPEVQQAVARLRTDSDPEVRAAAANISSPASVCTPGRVPETDLESSRFAEPPGESPVEKATPTSSPANSDRSLVRVFEALYGREPSPTDCHTLDYLAACPGLNSSASRYRSVIGAFDRQVLPTPFTVRFGEADLYYHLINGYELATDTADISIGMPMRTYQQYEPHMTRFFQSYLKPGMTAVDVGANIGYYTLLSSRLVGAKGRILAFEPNSENCRLILLSLRKNNACNVKLYPVGLSDQLGLAYFSPHLGSNGGFLSSADQVLMNPNCIVVPTLRLDDVVGDTHLDFLKIDTEGAEGLVVKGARKVLERDRPLVIAEFSIEMLPRVSGMACLELLTYFRSLNYSVNFIDRATGDLTRVQDLDTFLATYGPATRIEDLVFLPSA